MLSLGAMITGGRALLGAVNWPLLFYKVLAAGVMAALFGILCYREGVADTQLAQQTEATNQLRVEVQKHTIRLTEEVRARNTEVTTRLENMNRFMQNSAKLNAELSILRGEIHEVINSRPANDLCAPSDDELRFYEDLAERTGIRVR